MGVYRHTLIFEGLGHGATESLYYTIPSPSSVNAAFTLLSILKNKRAALLGAEWQIKGERIEQVVDDTGAKTKRIGSVAKFFLPGVQAQPAAESNVSLQVQFSDSTFAHNKLLFMCGPPRSLFPNGNAFDPNQSSQPGTWWSAFQSWRTLLISLGASWYSAPTVQTAFISDYVFSNTSGRTTYTLTAPGITWPATNVPSRVSVEFPLSRSPLDGVQLVIPISATSCYTAGPRPAAAWTVQGTMKLKGAQLISLATPNLSGQLGTITPENPMTRKRGRPLLVSRGRASVQVRW